MLENKNGPTGANFNLSPIDGEILMLSPMLLGLGLIILGLEHIVKTVSLGEEIEVVSIILIMVYSTLAISFGWMGYTDYKAYYDYSEEGLGVKYLLQKHKVIPWSEFQQICVCYTSYSTKGQGTAHSVLCFVKKGEKKNIYGRWKASNPYHSRSVISMEYTDELYAEVKKHCPYEIPDLRGKGNYRL